jgi:chromosome transmission fidelity protein 1
MLLHKETREALGINLKGNVIIIDEAHNLIEAINEIYSETLSMLQVQC